MKILYLCPRLPFPPIKGDRLRAFYQIRELSRNHRITLMTFSRDYESNKNQKIFKEICEQVLIIPHKKSVAIKNIINHILTSMPLQCAYYQSREMKKCLIWENMRRTYDIIHIQLARMVPYAIQCKHIPIFVDLIDALSVNMRKRLDRESLISKLFFFYEWYKMKIYEAKMDYYFDGAIISSPIDKKALPYSSKVEVVPNGVDLEYFHYFPPSQREPYTIVFTGNMSYFPNVDAVIYFCRHIYPKIKKIMPDVKFKIIGHSPKAVVSRLSAVDKGIEVVGSVDNIANHLGKAAIAVAPMLSGSGIQNKVLEAMATGTPVVATSLATHAIDLKPNRDVIMADNPIKFTEAVVNLLTNSPLRYNLGLNGRKLVDQKYSWTAIGKRLEELYLQTIDFFHKYRKYR